MADDTVGPPDQRPLDVQNGGQNDPVVSRMLQAGVPMTQQNYQRMTSAMRQGGYQPGSNAPYTTEQDRAARSYMDPAMWDKAGAPPAPTAQGGANDDATETVDNAAEDGAEAAPNYLDQMAGDGRSTSQPQQKQGATESQKVVGGASQGAETDQTPITAHPTEGGQSAQVGPGGATDGIISEILGAIMGVGGAAGVAKLLSRTGPGAGVGTAGQPQLEGPPAQKALPAPGAANRPQITDQSGVIPMGAPSDKANPPDVIAGQKPRYRVQAGSNNPADSGVQTMGPPDPEFAGKVQSGYDKAKAAGRVGRPKAGSKPNPMNAAIALRRGAKL